jgi:hypothetical protein
LAAASAEHGERPRDHLARRRALLPDEALDLDRVEVFGRAGRSGAVVQPWRAAQRLDEIHHVAVAVHGSEGLSRPFETPVHAAKDAQEADVVGIFGNGARRHTAMWRRNAAACYSHRSVRM